jgi:hypothetical protein
MKTIIAATLALAVCGPLAAAEIKAQPRAVPSESKAGPTEPPAITLSTGSMLPTKVRQAGQITDGARNVQVMDSNTIRNSGASDLASLLKRRGVTR